MNKGYRMIRGLGLFILIAAMFSPLGCQMTKDAVEEVGDTMEDAGEATMDAAEEAGDEIEDAAEEVDNDL